MVETYKRVVRRVGDVTEVTVSSGMRIRRKKKEIETSGKNAFAEVPKNFDEYRFDEYRK